MASEKDFDAEENPTVNGQVLFNPKSGTYWRINPDNDCEIQCANHREGEWKTFQRFAAPIIKLTADDEHKCASVTIKKISDSLSAFGRKIRRCKNENNRIDCVQR